MFSYVFFSSSLCLQKSIYGLTQVSLKDDGERRESSETITNS